MKISVIGAGGWGTALAIQAAKQHEVVLWAHDKEEAELFDSQRENLYYLPGIKIPQKIKVTSEFLTAADAEVWLFVPPSQFFRSVVQKFKPYADSTHLIVSATKGLEFPTEKRMSEILEEELPQSQKVVVISGPSHAEEVARDLPTTIVAASENIDNARRVQQALSNEAFRIYTHNDVLGVEICAAVKNVIAIAAGVLRGLGLGDNSMAALITRGLAEIRRLGLALGAQESTFAGLAGVGDLIVTCTSHFSRNRSVGEQLASGKKISEILAVTRTVAEGVETVKTVVNMEQKYNVQMPISRAVYDIIYQEKNPKDLLSELMTRPLKDEWA